MDDWDITLARLRRAFLDRVPSLADDASNALEGLAIDASSRDSLLALRLAFHKFAGSGGTYGFAALAATATEAEKRCLLHLEAGSNPSAADLDAWKHHIFLIRSEANDARDRLIVVPSGAEDSTEAPQTST